MKRYKKVYLEIINKCNLNCSFCPKNDREKLDMSLESVAHIFDELKPYTDYIYYHLMGEPLLHKDFDKILALAEEYGFYSNITTNGVLIKGALPYLCERAIRKIAFSLHSFEANKMTISLDEYIQNILIAVDALSPNTICEFRFWNVVGDDCFSATTKAILDKIKVHYNITADYITELMDSGAYKIANNIYIGIDHQFAWPIDNLEASQDTAKFCYGLKDQIGILVNGSVVPCCLDSEGKITLGNIFDSTLGDIISSERALNIQKGFSERRAVENLCKGCGFAKQHFL